MELALSRNFKKMVQWECALIKHISLEAACQERNFTDVNFMVNVLHQLLVINNKTYILSCEKEVILKVLVAVALY